MGASFKFFGKEFAKQLLSTTANPFVGLFIGILATSIVQSSSTTTSMTVALVAGGGLDVARAIPIVIGALRKTGVVVSPIVPTDRWLLRIKIAAATINGKRHYIVNKVVMINFTVLCIIKVNTKIKILDGKIFNGDVFNITGARIPDDINADQFV